MKKTVYIKSLVVLLSLILVLSFITACDDTGQTESLSPIPATDVATTPTPPADVITTPTPPTNVIVTPAPPATGNSEPRIIEFPVEQYLEDITVTKNKVVYFAFVYDEANVGKINRQHLFSFDLDGTNLTEMTNYTLPVSVPPDATYSAYWVNGITVDNNGYIWTYEGWYHYKDDVQINSGAAVRKLDADGTELLFIDTLEHMANPQMTSFIVDDEENIYLQFFTVTDPIFFVIDNKGTIIRQISNFYNSSGLVLSENGSVLYADFEIRYPDTDITTIREIDVRNNTTNDVFVYDDCILQIFPGFGDYDLLFSDRNDSLYGLTLKTGEVVGLLKWSDYGVDYRRIYDGGSLENITKLADGRLVFTNTTWDGSKGKSVLHVIPDFTPMG